MIVHAFLNAVGAVLLRAEWLVAFHSDIERYGQDKLLLAPTISHYLCFCAYLILHNQCTRSLGMLVPGNVNSCISEASWWYSSVSLGKLWFGRKGRNRMSLRFVWHFRRNTCMPLSPILLCTSYKPVTCSWHYAVPRFAVGNVDRVGGVPHCQSFF